MSRWTRCCLCVAVNPAPQILQARLLFALTPPPQHKSLVDLVTNRLHKIARRGSRRESRRLAFCICGAVDKAALGGKRLKRRVTIAALSECSGIPRRVLYRCRKNHPDQAPKSFDDLDSWIKFIGRIQNYPSERTRPGDLNETESSAEYQNGEYAEYSSAVERRERIFKLRGFPETRD